MSTEMNGIAVAGSILVDRINEVSVYPECGQLTKILRVSRAVGGCVPNVAIGLKTLLPGLEVSAIGKIGADEDGDYIVAELKKAGVDCGGIVRSDRSRTSFTEVISVCGGQRTFFTYNGANVEFGYADIGTDALQVRMLHLGYFLLLDRLDCGEGEKTLRALQERGIRTSIDLVSESSSSYAKILPCLRYVDNLIVNETEAGGLAGMVPTDRNISGIAERLKRAGVRERVIIHSPDYSVCLSDSGYTVVASYELPAGFIKGTTGAGDAFCAGCLAGIYDGLSDKEILCFASAAAAAALSAPDSVSGMRSKAETENLCKNFDRKKICL